MGSEISLLFAIGGYEVVLREVSRKTLNSLKEKLGATLSKLIQEGTVKGDPSEVLGRIRITDKLGDTKGCDYFLEAITENLDMKRELFRELEKIAPEEAILATNSSSYTVSEVFEGIARPERAGAMHFITPPLEIPLVEIVRGERTSRETAEAISEMTESIGKIPVIIEKETRGIILNRMIGVAIADGLWAIQKGEAHPAEIDAALHSIGIPNGVCEGADLIGLDVVYLAWKSMGEAHGKRFELPPLVERMIKERRLGWKTGEGFYDWHKGRPEIDPNLVGRFDAGRTVSLVVNEACHLLEEGVATPEMIDRVMELGLLIPVGPLKLAEGMGLKMLLETLEELYKRYGAELYLPHPLFKEHASSEKSFY